MKNIEIVSKFLIKDHGHFFRKVTENSNGNVFHCDNCGINLVHTKFGNIFLSNDNDTEFNDIKNNLDNILTCNEYIIKDIIE